MNVTSGTRLGPYEIVSRLGAGGMGEVWSARDTRLDRSVAVKILPAALAQDTQFKLRFEREARTISQLSHPNICTLYDVGDGFLVMELLEGETLADRIQRGALPMPEVLRYGVQIAEALGKAHRLGIVHRDLKPANVMITKGGAKLLDFGLAKSSAAVVNVDGATEHRPLTQEGTILGTFQYMAPEQLEGQEADARTDLFSLGALLYEMATGRRAFEGKTKTSLIAQIVSVEPKPIRELAPLTPPAFEHVVARCLSKDPDERWQNAEDVAENLRWTMASAVSPDPGARRPGMLWPVATAVLAMAVIALAVLLQRTPRPRVLWSDIAAPRDVRIVGLGERGGAAIAPDGQRILFVGRDKQNATRLYIRELAGADVRTLPTTEGATYPFWSPDSRSIAFFAHGKLKRVDADGTRASVIAEDLDGRGGTWGPDGTIVFAASSTSGLSRVRASGGAAEIVTKLQGDQNSLRFPWFLPDGKHFLYTAMGNAHRGIYIGSLDGSSSKKLIETYQSGVFAAGAIVFIRNGALVAHDFDLDALEVRGEPRQLLSGVSGGQSFADSGLSASIAGDIVFPSAFEGNAALAWRGRAGAIVQSLPTDRRFYEPAFAPGGKEVVATSDDPPDSLWVVDLQRGRSRRVNVGGVPTASPLWSPDAKRIYVSSTSGGKPAVAAVSPAGGTMQILAETPRTLYPDVLTPDGGSLVLDGPSLNGKDFDLWTLSLVDRKVRPMLFSAANEVRARFSPDGRFFSYTSDETGRSEVFVQTWPPSEAKWQVTFAGGDQAFWRGDGKELFCLAPNGGILSVSVQLQPDVTFGDPVVLFPSTLIPVSMTGNRNQYLVTSDGQRFLLFETLDAPPTHLKMITNFAQLLEQSR